MSRLEQARAEIARRRALAHDARVTWPWLADPLSTEHYDDVRHIAANDPAHVLAVLAAAEATLDRHTGDGHADWHDCNGYTHGFDGELCPDAAAVLDLYAPVCSTCGEARDAPPCSRNPATGQGCHTVAGGVAAGATS